MLEFPIRTTTPMTLTLIDENGEFIEIGSHVVTNYGEESYVGWDGVVFFEYLEEKNELFVTMPEGRSCQIEIILEKGPEEITDGIEQLGKYICQ